MTGRSHREPDLGERDPKRVIAFSDGVIAIAVTLLVLNLRPPDDTRHLVHGLLALWPSYVSYIITFMLVGNVWANHHIMFDHIRHADRMVLFLNCVLLMDIAVIPFAAAVLANSFRAGQGERTAVVVHGIVFELAAALFNVIWWYARRDRRLLASTIDAAGVRSIARRFLLGLAWIGGGTLLGALLPLLGVAMFASFIIFSGCRSPVRSALPGPARYKPASRHCPPRPARKRNLARTIPLPASNPRTSFAGARITNQRRPQSLSPGDAGNPGPGSPAAAG